MSPPIERARSQNPRFQSTIDPVEWPLENFPQPPPDGYWIPKFASPPPSRFPPPPLPSVPSDLTLDPPIMAFTYPLPSTLSEEDPTWLNKMLADMMRQRSHLEMCLSEAQADVANAHAEAGLADTELEEERDRMQVFLNMVAKVAGTGFVRRMLEDVEHSVEAMSKPLEDSDYSGSDSTSSSPRSTSANELAV